MTVRQTILAAFPRAGFSLPSLFAAFAAVTLVAAATAGPAQALTFENGDQAGASGSRWIDLNYTDPDRKAPKPGQEYQNGPRTGTGFYFGPTQPSTNQRFDSNHYFQPNNLLGK